MQRLPDNLDDILQRVVYHSEEVFFKTIFIKWRSKAYLRNDLPWRSYSCIAAAVKQPSLYSRI